MSAEASRAEALDALLADKRRHEGYLQRLEERREATPPHLYARLHQEYSARLDDLRRRAQAEAVALTEGLAEDEAAVEEVESRLTALSEERAEGELRAAVGEYDPRSWAKKLAALNAAIGAVEGERDARLAALEHRRALLAEASGAVEGAPIPALPAIVPPRIRPIVPPAPAEPASPSLALGMSRSLGTALPLPDGPLVPPVEPTAAEADAVPSGAPTAASADSGKSLRCDGCGTPNFPTEWYCERCGGELAAV